MRTILRCLLEGAIRFNRRNVPRLAKANMGARACWSQLLTRASSAFDLLVFSDENLFVIEPEGRGSCIVYLRNKQDMRRRRSTGGKAQMRTMAFGAFGRSGGPGGPLTGDVCNVPSGTDGAVTGAVYHSVLTNVVAPNMERRGEWYILLEDNASSHRACCSVPMAFHRVTHSLDPAHWPDFNATECNGHLRPRPTPRERSR